MFTLDLVDLKGVLNALTTTNTEFIFMNGRICTLHGFKIAMMTYEDKRIKIKNPPIFNDMINLENLLKSRTIVNADICPEEGKIYISKPYKFSPPIPKIIKADVMDDVNRNLEMIEILKKDPRRFKDKSGNKHVVATFRIDSTVFGDALERIGTCESVQLKTGKTLSIKNMKTGAFAELPIDSRETTLYVSNVGRELLQSSIGSGDDCKIRIVDECFIMIEQKLISLIAGRIPEAKERSK